MKQLLHHLFLPHESNNYRAKFLHHSTLLLIIAALFITHFSVSSFSTKSGQVLGISSNITASDLLELTNNERELQGLPPLRMNEQLSQAASEKAQDMFSRDYWAHNAPDGTTPWVFVKSSGYDYLYAGENLARGFTTSSDVVSAWMASPGHKENLLSSNYEDIGFAIVDGKLTGDETILVVQMFGRSKSIDTAESFASDETPVDGRGVVVASDLRGAGSQLPQERVDVASIQTQPLIDVEIFSKTSSLILLSVLLGLLLLDLIIVQRQRVVRILSHNLDHVIFLGIVLITIIIVGKGVVL